eukprot:TRINITY_DN6268_c0_g1_i2.p1 TRINITY_DN6268_c0_g1~~TRINITY_DN6268_c0_g1_i2.p1  ORF type:complete len:337 (+),score=61.48 TRINITY_DN6268_c0_g1_i2:23-1012(+)
MALHQKLQACLHEASNYADIYTLDHVKGAVANDPELQVQLSTLFGSVSVFIEQVKSLKRSGSLEFRHIWLVIEPRLWQLEAEHSSTRDLYGGDGTVQLFVYEAGFGLPSLSLQCTTALNILQLYKIPFALVANNNEAVSPNETLPVLARPNDTIVDSLSGIIGYATTRAGDNAKPPVRHEAVESVVMDTLACLLEYEQWCFPAVSAKSRQLFYSNRYSFPLDWILTRRHQHLAEQRVLQSYGRALARPQALQAAQQAFGALGVHYEACTSRFLNGESPGITDAIVASLVQFVSKMPGLEAYHELVKEEPRLVQHAMLFATVTKADNIVA